MTPSDYAARIMRQARWRHRREVLRLCVPAMAFGLLCWLLGWVCCLACLREDLR